MPTTTAEISDTTLVAAIRRGDDGAFETLFERYRLELVRYVRGMTPDAPDQAEDVVQEVFSSALQSMRSNDKPIAFRPWIYRIAKNACIDRHRRVSRVQSVPIEIDEPGGPEEFLSEPDSTPEDEIDRREALDSLRKAFAGLDDPHHKILVMRELEGRSYNTIAARMGLSESAVQSMLFRARHRLKIEYDEIATGQRCESVQSSLEAGGAIGRGRRRKRLLLHLRDCSPCRRHAFVLGFDELVTEAAGTRTLREKAAALLPPLPFGLWRATDAATIAGGGDHVSALPKFAVAAFAALVLAGGGVATERAINSESNKSPATSGSESGKQGSTSPAAKNGKGGSKSRADTNGNGSGKSDKRRSSSNGSTEQQPGSNAGSGVQGGSTQGPAGAGSQGGGKTKSNNGVLGEDGLLGDGGPAGGAGGAVGGVGETVQGTLDKVHDTVGQTGDAVGNSGLPGGQQVGKTVDKLNGGLQKTTQQVTGQVDKLTGKLGK